MQTRRGVIGIVGVIGVVAWQAVATSQQQAPRDDRLPRFAPGGQLLPPVGWEAWVMVGSSPGLSYAAAPPPAAGAAPGMFHNVYVQPWAYREFIRTGAFPERTMFVLSFYEASRKSARSEEHTSELQSPCNLVCRLLLEKKKKRIKTPVITQNMNDTRAQCQI